jgi:hypothetical protein
MKLKNFLDPILIIGFMISITISVVLFAVGIATVQSITIGLLSLNISLLLNVLNRTAQQESKFLDILGFSRSLFKESEFQVLLDTIGFASDEERIKNFRQKWHHYHVTKMGNKYLWRHAIFDFSRLDVKGRLTGEVVFTNKAGEKLRYHVEAGMRDDRWVCLAKPIIGNEPTMVEIQPFMGQYYFENQFGVAVIETWDSEFALTPTIMSKNPINGTDGIETIPPAISEELDKMWESGFKKMHIILPRIVTKESSQTQDVKS